MYGYPPQTAQREVNKLAAGLLAIFLGTLGIHAFYMGNNSMGITLLCVSLLSLGILAPFCSVFAIIQGIAYLSSSDYDFYTKYVVRKQWI